MFLSGSNQNPTAIWSLQPHSMSGFPTHYRLQVQKLVSKHLFISVGPLASFGGGGGRYLGPTPAELPHLQLRGYFLDEYWSDGKTERRLVCGASGGKLGRGQLHLPQQEWVAPQLYRGPDQRG